MRNNNVLPPLVDVKVNAAQEEAITHRDGPAMVLAGPGSGKTFVIVQRLKYLIEEYGADPSSILVITFTKAAAIEMQQRFLKITDSSYPEVSFGTFHSLFYNILRDHRKEAGFYNNIEIADELFKYKLVKDILLNVLKNSRENMNKLKLLDENEIIKDITSEISRIKNAGLSPSSVSDAVPYKEHFEAIFTGYNAALKSFGKIDFDDMSLICAQLFENRKDIAEQYKSRFKYILIDEYQDINEMQQNNIEAILNDDKNLFVVGDDDQAIYGFRGAKPGIMMEFKDRMGGSVHLINLSVNYRCGKAILDNASLVIRENKMRFKKNIVSGTGADGYVVARRYKTRETQYEAMSIFLSGQNNLNDIGILCRTNSECKTVASFLRQKGIKSNLENKDDASLYDDEAVLLCLYYLSFSCIENSRALFYKIMNKPLRYISRESAMNELIRKEDVLSFYRGNRERTKAVEKLFRDISMIGKMRPSLSVRFIRKEVGIDKLFPNSTGNLDLFEEMARNFRDSKSFIGSFNEEKEKSDNQSKGKKKFSNAKDIVNILTLHGSKGLEYKYVWIPDLNEGIIPSRSAIYEPEKEEERRMLYVGMTRAKEALIMSYICGTKENAMLPSRFLRPIRSLWEKTTKNDNI
ncbi:ATP-dependent helicase [Butyrivibrio sp. LB2008]|uniref:ATP-dependent helicase n=1 Tax=Butyrivibrio sp. LB2008 TaxID=1408305 RepID=UPI00047CDD8D|nr:ATP-dependent helicase [Butyrivibrio sp. LB2008]